MTNLDDLKAVSTAKPLEGTDTGTVLFLDAEKEIDGAVHALSRFFGEDDSRTAVQLDVHGDKVGYLNRRDFFSAKSGSRLGEAQLGELPRPQDEADFTFIKLACPVQGCKTLVLKIHYDERDLARCPEHADEILHVVA